MSGRPGLYTDSVIAYRAEVANKLGLCDFPYPELFAYSDNITMASRLVWKVPKCLFMCRKWYGYSWHHTYYDTFDQSWAEVCTLGLASYEPAEHLEGVLERGLRLGGDVALDVVLHGDAAEGDGEDALASIQ